MVTKTITAAVLIVWAIFAGACSTVCAESAQPLPEALEALQSDEQVTVAQERLPLRVANAYYYVFAPTTGEPTTAFIFYPGGAVDPRAYAPPARAIAAEGFLTFIVCMPNDLALLGQRRANRILPLYPGIERWAIGGHSLGGVAACAYTQNFDDRIDGVVLWASYPSETFRIDDKPVAAVSIYGTNDGLSTLDEIETSRQHLPDDTSFVAIEGGNHTYFGWYEGAGGGELQEGDNPADITRQDQQDQVVQATVAFLKDLR